MPDLARCERILRRDDKALRLRASAESASVLVERKTFRGRIGCLGPGGLSWLPDAGRRREEGHVLVATIPADFDFENLRASLRAADSWRRAEPLWRTAEREDEARAAAKKRRRSDNIRYRTEDFWNRFVWRTKSRVAVPERIA